MNQRSASLATAGRIFWVAATFAVRAAGAQPPPPPPAPPPPPPVAPTPPVEPPTLPTIPSSEPETPPATGEPTPSAAEPSSPSPSPAQPTGVSPDAKPEPETTVPPKDTPTNNPIEPPPSVETAPTAPPPPANRSSTDGEAASDDGPRFIKGDLIHVGTRRLLSRYDHVGVAAGPYIVDNDFFLSITPGTAFYLDPISFAVGIPLNLLLVEGGSLNFGSLKLRREDWDEISDYAKVVQFLTIGRKEDNLYFTVNSLRPATIGHGMLVNKYQGNIDVDRHLTGVIFDAYNQYGGFEMQANDVTFTNQILGGLVFIKPLSFFTDNVLAQSLSFGAEYVADLKAPKCIKMGANSDECVQGSGHHAGFDPYTGESLDHTFVRSDPDTGRFAVEETTVHAAGFSTEFKVYKDERNVDLKIYGTYHRFLNEGGGDGLAAGFLARLNAGERWINAFRLQGEYHNFGDGFLPGYFNSVYEIKKYYYPTAANPYQVTPTKYQAVFGDSANGFERPEGDRRNGVNLEASWALFKGARSAKQVGLGFGLQDSTGADDTNFYAHLEFPFLGFLQIFGSYLKFAEAGLGSLFDGGMFTADNAVVLTGLRLQILPVLFLNAHYSRNYRVVRSPGSEYHLGNDSVVDSNGEPSPYFTEAPLFENVQTLFFELEFGWEFDDAT